MLKKPAVIRLYDEDGKVTDEFKLCILPWGMVKKATAIFKKLDGAESQDAEIDEMTNFLCEAFKNRFTAEDLNDHGDTAEVLEATNILVGELSKSSPNAAAGTVTPLK